MVTDEQLRRKIIELKKSKEKIEILRRERDITHKLKQEVRELEKSTSSRFRRGLKRGFSVGGKILLKSIVLIAKDIESKTREIIQAKRVAKQKERELQNLKLKRRRKRK